MTTVNTENNNVKTNMIEELQISRAATSATILIDVIIGKNVLRYTLLFLFDRL